MLQQILQEMWVDPELLAELDDSQKQTLFCRMREEQVRRWVAWDSEHPSEDDKKKDDIAELAINSCPTLKTAGRKTVDFLLGADGEPWVWVMGEHADDLSIDTILEQEAREKARRQAEKEAEHLRKSMEAELTELLDLNQKQIEAMEAAQQKDEDLGIYCSVDELKERMKDTNNKINIVADKRDILHEISLNKPKKVSQRVALWEKRVMEERTSEIFKRLQRKQREVVREAEEAEHKQDQLWREQERKAKEAEFQIREIARRAREEHRRTSVLDMEVEANSPSPTARSPKEISISPGSVSPTLSDCQTAKPPSKEAVIEWFRSSEVARRAGMDPDVDEVVTWFHGLITRQEAERVLMEQPVGSFLVRVSERIWGYAISYRDTDRCKHYLVDASNGHYQFLGANQLCHNTLGDLVSFHGEQPITALGDEKLLLACPRADVPTIFQGLLSSSFQW